MLKYWLENSYASQQSLRILLLCSRARMSELRKEKEKGKGNGIAKCRAKFEGGSDERRRHQSPDGRARERARMATDPAFVAHAHASQEDILAKKICILHRSMQNKRKGARLRALSVR